MPARPSEIVRKEMGAEAGTDGSVAPDHFASWLVLIALVALLLRLTWIIAQQHEVPFTDGTGFYFPLARALAHGKGFINPHLYAHTGRAVANANHTPAWPLLLTIPHLAGLNSFLSSQIFAGLLGTATVVVVGLAGRAIVGPRVGLIAAAISAVYPNLWVYERELMSETLALLLVAITVLVAYRYRAHATAPWSVMLGGLCGLLALTHPNYLVLMPLLFIPLILRMPHAGRRRRVELFAVAVVAAAAIVAPWVAYNAQRFDEPVLMTTAVGLTLVDANCNVTYSGPRLGSWGVLCSFPQPKTEDAAKIDAEFRRRAQHYVRANLDRLPVVLAAREGRTWAIFHPLQQNHFDSQIGSALWVERLRLLTYWALAPMAVGGALVLRKRRMLLAPLSALFLLVAITAALSFGDTRYRAPAEIAIVLLAAVAVDAALSRRGLPLRWA